MFLRMRLVGGVVILLAAAVVLAQPPGGPGGKKGKGGFGGPPGLGRGGFGGPGGLPGAAGLLRIPEVRKELATTDEQNKKIDTLLDDLQEKLRTSMGAIDFRE